MLESDVPRTMKNLAIRNQRIAALRQPHIAPLTDFVVSLRTRDANEYPYFDPADGGIDASILFLLEKPGPMTVDVGRGSRAGSGFISRDNDDPTAEASFRFWRDAGIPRKQTVLWNIVPGWNGTRSISNTELEGGVADLRQLLALLPNLRVVVLVGQKAARAEALVQANTNLTIFKSDHPSPLVRARHPSRWLQITAAWQKAWQVASR